MTFLMHAASGTRRKTLDERARLRAATIRRQDASPKQSPLSPAGDPFAPGSTRAQVAPRFNRFHGISDEDDVERGGGGSPSAPSQANIADRRGGSDEKRDDGLSERHENRVHASDLWAREHGDGFDDRAEALHERGTGVLDPSLVVFKTAWSTVEGMLWKEQVRSWCNPMNNPKV